MSAHAIKVSSDEDNATRVYVDPCELILGWFCSMDAIGQQQALIAINAIKAAPPPRTAQGNRDNLLRYLRIKFYKSGSARKAAEEMRQDARGINFASENGSNDQRKSLLHQIGRLNGGEFPSAETIRKVIAGFDKN